jgi:hypothetical protein
MIPPRTTPKKDTSAKTNTQAVPPTGFHIFPIVAQDPAILDEHGKILMTTVRIPHARLEDGPRSHRFEVVDYDATSDTLYKPAPCAEIVGRYSTVDGLRDAILAGDPHAHQVNLFATASSVLFEFERALGRQVDWGFDSHQIRLLPHAAEIANAYYSKRDECLAFGYFRDRSASGECDRDRRVFLCLSRDIIAHETTHAILDGLRGNFTRPSSVDQHAFHEGFADIVALLSVLKSEEMIRQSFRTGIRATPAGEALTRPVFPIDKVLEFIKGGKDSYLYKLAEQFGQAESSGSRAALRDSIELPQNAGLYSSRDYLGRYPLGEVLVAVILHSFTDVWASRIQTKAYKAAGHVVENGSPLPSQESKATSGDAGRVAEKSDAEKEEVICVDIGRVAEEGAKAAQHLLSLLIRAIDYLPPVHIDFKDFLSALLTADTEVCPDDAYDYRGIILRQFETFGIEASSDEPNHVWRSGIVAGQEIRFRLGNIEENRWSKGAMYRLIWENQAALGLVPRIYTQINSVRPCWRVGPDGYILRETVVEYVQILKNADRDDLEYIINFAAQSGSASERNLVMPGDHILDRQTVDLAGGGTLIFDEFGTLKYHVHNRISSSRQNRVLEYLWHRDQLGGERREGRRALNAHLARSGLFTG